MFPDLADADAGTLRKLAISAWQSEEGEEKKGKKSRKAQRGHGPTPQGALPIEPVLCELEDCSCTRCGGDLTVLAEQFEVSELISSVRRSFVLKEVKRQKYACSGCGKLCAAPGPLRLVPGGRYDIDFAVQVALDKYLDAMPLERQLRKMARVGLDVTSQTLWDQLHVLYLLLLPTFLALQDQVRADDVLHVDETRWRMMGKGSSKTWWLWVLAGASGVVFDLQPSRGSDACRNLLNGFSGVLIADGYGVYASLEKAFSKYGEQLPLDGIICPSRTSPSLCAGCTPGAGSSRRRRRATPSPTRPSTSSASSTPSRPSPRSGPPAIPTPSSSTADSSATSGVGTSSPG